MTTLSATGKLSLAAAWMNGRLSAEIDERTCRIAQANSGSSGAGGGNRTHGLGIMRPSLYH